MTLKISEKDYLIPQLLSLQSTTKHTKTELAPNDYWIILSSFSIRNHDNITNTNSYAGLSLVPNRGKKIVIYF